MSEEGPPGDDRKPPHVTGDFPAPGPRTTQRGTLPPSPIDTPTSVPAARDRIRSTPVPINLERLLQKLLVAALPLGRPDEVVRAMLVEGLKTKASTLTPSRANCLALANLWRALSEDD